MARDIDLNQLRISELRALSERIAQEIARRRMLRRHGGAVVERAPSVYRNPSDPTQTWSGRGLRPGWVQRALDEGRSLASLRD